MYFLKTVVYSANNNHIQINVSGWRTVESNANVDIKYNGCLVEAIIHTEGTVNVTTDWQWFNNWIPSGYRPTKTMAVLNDSSDIILAYGDNGTLKYRARQGALTAWKLNGVAYWKKV